MGRPCQTFTETRPILEPSPETESTAENPILIAGPVQSGGGLVLPLHDGPQDGSHVLDWRLHSLQYELSLQQRTAAWLVGREAGADVVGHVLDVLADVVLAAPDPVQAGDGHREGSHLFQVHLYEEIHGQILADSGVNVYGGVARHADLLVRGALNHHHHVILVSRAGFNGL